MGRAGAYLMIDRKQHGQRPALESVQDHEEFTIDLLPEEQCDQASRCMNCGVAFCQSGITLSGSKHVIGCPLQNLIPETNDLLYRRRWDDAVGRLFLTNPFPEFTGRVCPSPCESACNLGLHDSAVTIHDNERALSDYAWEVGIVPLARAREDAPLVSIVGSGPAGLACAWELARCGLRVQVYERSDRPGGLLMYGIPNMKLPKWVIDRRLELMRASGIQFVCGVDGALSAHEIEAVSDAVVLAVGSTVPRAVDIPGSDLSGVFFAVDYLGEATAALLEERDPAISAEGKDVVVIGGGDTGVDCVATALRQHARTVRQVIRAQQPGTAISAEQIWPFSDKSESQGYGQREAEALFGEDPRVWSVDTIAFEGDATDVVTGVVLQDLSYEGGRHVVEGTERTIPAQLVLIAKGFVGPEEAIFQAFGVSLPDSSATSFELVCEQGADGSEDSSDAMQRTPIFVTGDARQGSSLVATAIADGLACAREVQERLH